MRTFSAWGQMMQQRVPEMNGASFSVPLSLMTGSLTAVQNLLPAIRKGMALLAQEIHRQQPQHDVRHLNSHAIDMLTSACEVLALHWHMCDTDASLIPAAKAKQAAAKLALAVTAQGTQQEDVSASSKWQGDDTHAANTSHPCNASSDPQHTCPTCTMNGHAHCVACVRDVCRALQACFQCWGSCARP